MSGHADTIRPVLTEVRCPSPSELRAAKAALDALVAENQQQADRIAWLEGDVAGWRIKLAECEEENQRLEQIIRAHWSPSQAEKILAR